MPIYEYECRSCGKRTELLQRMSDPPLATCPHCGAAVKKLFSSPAVQFKGSGWYVTDYAGKGSAAKKAGASSEGKSEASSEGKPDAKPEGKSEAKESKKESAAGGGKSAAD